ncbi:epimerase, putative [Bodo saltans]|uniref:Epimerase, putative n=1 Tax=Bodo saltans TaxID=75058 RepID=A0A0S4ILP0_BODSA|nr:epimerase, putative [Bodo saltans]|eukprot:CUE71484.1 epimerase, putative [Bodo saltans]
MSLDDMDVIRRPKIIEQPHILGPGTDFFTEDGRPVRPQPSAHTIHKVFSGSALDLNAMGGLDDQAPPLEEGGHGQDDATMSSIFQQVNNDSDRERNKASKNKTTVLVVGGNGFVASHVVALLLQAGYTVRITVSEPLESTEQLSLYSMVPDAGHRLSVTEADMTNAASFRDVIRGCKYVIHCGVSQSQALREKDVVRAHVESVQALFDAIRLNGKPTLKRVILTGSAAAVFNIQDPTPASGKFDESSWNNRATAKTDPVPFAKLSFEREAWRLQKMFGVELIVILPSIVVGPSLLHETSEAMRTILDLASGSSVFPFAPNLFWNFVDVRDVAVAHVRAMEHADLTDQRLIVSNQCLSLSEIGKLIKRSFPHLNPPTQTAPTWITLIVAPLSHARVKLSFLWRTLGVRKALDSSKSIRLLDLQLTPMEVTVADAVSQLISSGYLAPPPTAEQQAVIDNANATKTLLTRALVGLSFASVAAAVVFKIRSKK